MNKEPIKNIYRTNCCICNGLLTDIYKFQNFPIYMGVCDSSVPTDSSDLIYCTCNDCNTLQIRTLIPPEILYKDNHNTDIVGEMWTNHYKQFSHFIFNDIDKTDVILEVGDPACKMSSLNKDGKFNKWLIIEPSNLSNVPPKVIHIKTVLDDNFNETIDPVNIVIFSHSFEHMLEPRKIILKLHDLIKDDGYIFMSLPNMNHISENGLFPPNCLSFEHTFFCNLEVLKYIIRDKFEIERVKSYESHSIFYKLKKIVSPIKNISDVKQSNEYYNSLFLNNIKKSVLYVNNINEKLKFVDSYYVYGAHISTQFLLQLGINQEKITGVLDNSKLKIGKTLYGTPYKVYNPTILKDGIHYVLCNVGAFTNEIKIQLLKINDKIIFI